MSRRELLLLVQSRPSTTKFSTPATQRPSDPATDELKVTAQAERRHLHSLLHGRGGHVITAGKLRKPWIACKLHL